jgi:uncharacterized protein
MIGDHHGPPEPDHQIHAIKIVNGVSGYVVARLGDRIHEQVVRYGLQRFVVELHGGEPLLLGKARMQQLIDMLRRANPGLDLQLMLQTNGLLLDRDWLDLFDRNDMSFGISLDGPPEITDRHRVYVNGRGSAARLLDIIRHLRAEAPQFDSLLGGVLAVVDPDQDGAEVVRWFTENGFAAFDFLLPDGTRVNPPPDWKGPEPYRRFLLQAFDKWYKMGTQAPHIRMFEMMMLGLMGHKTSLDALGGDLRSMCVVESDGSIGVSDVLRICLGPYAKDSINIFDHSLDAHADHYRVSEIQRPASTCLRCPYFASCGGGYIPHRFDGISFGNPSFYCEVLYALSARMEQVMRRDLPSRTWVQTGPAVLASFTEGSLA